MAFMYNKNIFAELRFTCFHKACTPTLLYIFIRRVMNSEFLFNFIFVLCEFGQEEPIFFRNPHVLYLYA